MNTMKAVRIHSYGDAREMMLEELPMPEPGPGLALVRVLAASVNYLDVQQRRGELTEQAFYKKEGAVDSSLPATIGSQCVGVIEQFGENADLGYLKLGDRVICGGGGGTYATHVVAPAKRLIPVPEEVGLEQAAGGLVQGFMAYCLSHESYPVQPGEWCLVHAAAGGIGLLLCQMIKLRGGRIIGVVSSAAKADAAREAGAEEIILSGESDIAAEVKRITGGSGVRVVYDGVGKDTFEAGLSSLAPRGYMVLFGQASGFVPPFDLMRLQELGSLYVTRFSAKFYTDKWMAFSECFLAWTKEGKLNVPIDRSYPLSEAAEAHEAFESRRTIGRVLLIP